MEAISLMDEIIRRFSKNIPLRYAKRGGMTLKNVVFFHYMIRVVFY
ncbi:hypothetical protein ATN83_1950 [Raoultella ornithinolytica]|nr:hypothetical protein ATN83_1950 [Raoultella ornithinolytica]KDV95878.1 hypothetical protein AB00_1483 [Raoultella ornithinolytica 2-156-04_S1_C1]KDX15395.1 hypothetical protein AB28_1496 [Raoultella ornithinolytica 2-156-04_S1_C2]